MLQSKKGHKLFDLKLSRLLPFVFTLLFVFPIYTLRGEVINISNSSSWKSTYPRIAVDSGDNIHVVWVEKYSDSQGDLFYTTSDSPGSQWSTPLNLSNSSQAYSENRTACDIDVDDSSRIYAAWIEDHLIKLKIFSDGTWGSSFEVASSQEGLDTISIAVSSGGNIYMVWWSVSGNVFSRAQVNNVWEDTKIISASGKRSKFPRIAVGNQMVYSCWSQKNQALDQYEIAYASRNTSLNSSWSSVEEVYPNGLSQSYPAVEVDSSDIPYVIWTSLINNSRVVHSSHWTGSDFSSPVAISGTQMLHYASLFEQYGDLYACWQVGGYEAGLAIFYNLYQNGSWSDEKAIAQSDGSTFSDISASPSAGNIYVTWDSNDEIYFTSIGSTPISNIPPVADFNFSPQTGLHPLQVTFDASLSYDPDGQIIQYSWDFGDGTTGLGKIVTHTYMSWGIFTITLLIEDNSGDVDTKTETIEVLRLFQPLNIRWDTFNDNSMFQTRYIAVIKWEKNPNNNNIAEVVLYRIYRKENHANPASFKPIGSVYAHIFTYDDYYTGEKDKYSYTVTSVDGQGHESPIDYSSSNLNTSRKSNKNTILK